MTTPNTVDVPHLGGSQIGYRFGAPYDPALPTLVLVNSFVTSAELYRPQFQDPTFAGKVNLLAIELFGHGATRTRSEQFTYWDSAIANNQVLARLGIDSAWVLGTSQGGWVAVRMALLEPARIRGVIPLGTSMDYESQASISRGCWNGDEFNTPVIDGLAGEVGADWEPSDAFCDGLVAAGLGPKVADDERLFWHRTIKANYQGDDGRRRMRMCAINLRDRDGLYGRLDAVRCPVLWMHGTEDEVYSIANAEDGIRRFTGSPAARLQIIDGGNHFLSATHPKEVNEQALAFIRRGPG